MTPLDAILGFFISLAANGATAAIHANRQKRLDEALEDEEALRNALDARRPLRDEVRLVCMELARSRHGFGISPEEEPLWSLLNDEAFQNDLAEWLMAGGIEEGHAVKARLSQSMATALSVAGVSTERIEFLSTGYFDALDRAAFSNPILARWRHQLSLDYLREQVSLLRDKADEAVGIYSSERQKAALDSYCEKALRAWDIIDLSNLPEGDIHIATQTLLLRRLYMPLRVNVEIDREGGDNDEAFAELEQRRDSRRLSEAGRRAPAKRETEDHMQRSSVGERLDIAHRLVVLGDPGGGKTTMMRWLATAYLLRYRNDDAYRDVPDTNTLPDRQWIPVLIRCRDLGDTDLCRGFPDFLAQHLQKTELLPEEADVMRAVILDSIAKGDALLLVDGLDEIVSPRVRMMFCQELERTAARYPEAHIVVTSRIVGYRDMSYHMGSGFEHGTIAELTRADKDLFAQRWVAVTEQHQPEAEKRKRVQDLLEAIHSSDRIERLTGNPMLLTTLALVKRKLGKLPSRRTKLYAEAVSVLLNWNPHYYEIIDEEEAIPQLEFVAYEMCRRGVQRLTEEEILDLLDRVRQEYPNVRAVRRQEPRVFLQRLEARSSILIKSGGHWLDGRGREQAVWEFRHLTFQEYLAARALLDGKYPDRDREKTLAAQIAPLAGAVKERRRPPRRDPELEVTEAWQEVLRLLAADCKDDDVDDVLTAIAIPLPDEDRAQTRRPRIVLAARCLADEPNASEEKTEQILSALAKEVSETDGDGISDTNLTLAAVELGKGLWAPLLKKSIIQEFRNRNDPDESWNIGGLWGMVEVGNSPRDQEAYAVWFGTLPERLRSTDEMETLAAAFTVMQAAYEGKALAVPGLIDELLNLLRRSRLIRFASAWALGWLSSVPRPWRHQTAAAWQPGGDEVLRLIDVLKGTDPGEADTCRWLVSCLQASKDLRSTKTLIGQLQNPDIRVRRRAVEALTTLGDPAAVAPLIDTLDDSDAKVRALVAKALGTLADNRAVSPLIDKLDDPDAKVQVSVVESLSTLGDIRAVPELIHRIGNPDIRVRKKVSAALATLVDATGVRSLMDKLNDAEVQIRVSAAEALADLGDVRAVPALMELLDDPEVGPRVSAAEALERLGDTRAVPRLIEKLDDPGIQVMAVQALASLGDVRAVPHLIDKLDDPLIQMRVSVAQALGRLGDAQAVSPLIERLGDPDAKVRLTSADALARLGDTRAIPRLINMLDDPTVDVQVFAAAAAKRLGDARGSAALAQFLENPDANTRQAVVRACAQGQDLVARRLLSLDFDAAAQWIDPRQSITNDRVAHASMELGLTSDEVRLRYESLAVDLGLNLSWTDHPASDSD